MNVALTGCSGGGKSALLAEMARRGLRTFEEPGRIVVRRALAGEGGALPEEDLPGFVLACLEVSRGQLAAAAADEPGVCLFDRTPIDHLAALRHRGIDPPAAMLETIAVAAFHPVAVFAPPWPALFVNDAERRHDFPEAQAECGRVRRAYAALGFTLLELPRLSVEARAVWLSQHHPALAREKPSTAGDPALH